MAVKKELVSVTLLDTTRKNPLVFNIPKFPHEPALIRRHEKVYLRDSPGVYVEAFGYLIDFRTEPVTG